MTLPTHYRTDGFTLIELMVVLCVIAIVFALGTVNLHQARAARELEASVETVATMLRLSHQTAMNGTVVTVTLTSSTWQSTAADGRKLSAGTLPTSVTLTASKNPLVFAVNGSLPTPSTLTLTSQGTGRAATLRLAASTGTVQIQLP